MNLAVLFGEIGFISRYKVIEGIRAHAAQDRANVVLYTSEGFLYEELEDYIKGEYAIYSLPALDQYDGVIVDLDSIQNQQVADSVREKIEKANIPCVSFNQVITNADVVYFDNCAGFRKLLEHLVQEHGIRDVVYLSGPKGNRDARERKDVFLNVMREHDIEIRKNQIYYGNFDFESGRQLVRDFMSAGRKLPQAFVAANDFMAIGIMGELKKQGIQIPDQVIVTGYDYCDLADLVVPSLSSVDRGEFRAGELAYDKLMERIRGTGTQSFCSVEGRPVIAHSCGCGDGKPVPNSDICADIQINRDGSFDLLKGLSIEFSNVDTLTDFECTMEKYISRMGMEFFYFCQCGSRESYYSELDIWAEGKMVDRDVTQFQSTVWCPIAYENGEWNSYTSFDINLLFPPNSLYKKEDSYYIVMPVHQGKVCIGYSIIGNFRTDLSGRVIQHLVLNIDQVLGNIRKQDIMKTMLAKINKKWQFDELTGLYNRSGMNVQSEILIEEACKQNMGISLMFFDLDGLKRINDTQGHEAGDQYIKRMAELLLAGKAEDDLAIRYGGDEYILISKQASNEECMEKFEALKDLIQAVVSVSAGCVFRRIQSLAELKLLVEEADRRMYQNKKDRKAKVS